MFTATLKVIGWLTLCLFAPTVASGLWIALDDDEDEEEA